MEIKIMFLSLENFEEDRLAIIIGAYRIAAIYPKKPFHTFQNQNCDLADHDSNVSMESYETAKFIISEHS